MFCSVGVDADFDAGVGGCFVVVFDDGFGVDVVGVFGTGICDDFGGSF